MAQAVTTGEEADVFKHYRVLRQSDGRMWELGRGAMGVTYKAEDINLRSFVALKVINAHTLHTDTDRARFRREARAAASLRHPNVAAVYHLSDDDQSFFYAMEFIEGETLHEFVARRGPVDVELSLYFVDQVADALCAAARKNLIHRDIKPANVMVVREDDEEGEAHRRVKLIDFGLAKSIGAADMGSSGGGPITQHGFVGTTQYASPEQLEELELDNRTDIYSLGITLWFLLTGRPPFIGPIYSVSAQHLHRPPPFELLDAAGIPPAVHVLLGRMLAKCPAERPSAKELRQEIAACVRAVASASRAAHTRPVSLPPQEAFLARDRAMEPTTLTEQSPMPPPREATTLTPELSTAVQDPAIVPPSIDPEFPATQLPFALAAPITLLEPVAPTTHLPPPTVIEEKVVEEPPPLPIIHAEKPVEEARCTAEPSALSVGRTLNDSFQLVEQIDERNYFALDLRTVPPRQCRVQLSVDDQILWEQACAQLARLQGSPHPGLVEVLGYAVDRHTRYVATERLTGFTLEKLLRVRKGALPLAEALQLAALAASVADHSCFHDLPPLRLDPYSLWVHFPGGEMASPESLSANWPDFVLKATTLEVHSESADQTWAGANTVVPQPSSPTRLSLSGAPVGHHLVRDLARLVYELLGGRLAALSLRYSPLSAMNEAGNELLRAALLPMGTEYRLGSEFVAALVQSSARTSAITPSPEMSLPVSGPDFPDFTPIPELVDGDSERQTGIPFPDVGDSVHLLQAGIELENTAAPIVEARNASEPLADGTPELVIEPVITAASIVETKISSESSAVSTPGTVVDTLTSAEAIVGAIIEPEPANAKTAPVPVLVSSLPTPTISVRPAAVEAAAVRGPVRTSRFRLGAAVNRWSTGVAILLVLGISSQLGPHRPAHSAPSMRTEANLLSPAPATETSVVPLTVPSASAHAEGSFDGASDARPQDRLPPPAPVFFVTPIDQDTPPKLRGMNATTASVVAPPRPEPDATDSASPSDSPLPTPFHRPPQANPAIHSSSKGARITASEATIPHPAPTPPRQKKVVDRDSSASVHPATQQTRKNVAVSVQRATPNPRVQRETPSSTPPPAVLRTFMH